jgi:hypothetical protein
VWVLGHGRTGREWVKVQPGKRGMGKLRSQLRSLHSTLSALALSIDASFDSRAPACPVGLCRAGRDNARLPSGHEVICRLPQHEAVGSPILPLFIKHSTNLATMQAYSTHSRTPSPTGENIQATSTIRSTSRRNRLPLEALGLRKREQRT